ncbi:hypothetical protein [Aliiroseovarius sp.]|uniref:hypothetical protein n=1 Tax=Aliiroseovarius sp. TaxID=1872442 RepID=UPI003BAD5958
MTELILHIGHPKTGTTALQRGYLRQRRELAAKGVLYPYLNKESDRHTTLVPALIGKELVTGDVAFYPHWPGGNVMGQSLHIWQDVQAQIAEHQPNKVVLSGEGFFQLRRRWQMEAMCERLSAVFDKITVVAYLRSPQSRHLSSYQQGLKTAGNRAFLPSQPYMPVVSVWSRFGPGPLDLHIFDRKALISGDVVEDFATRYTPEVLDEIRARPNRELNTSLSAEAMAVLETHIHRVDELTGAERRAAWQPLREIMLQLDQSVPGFTRPRLTVEASLKIQRRSLDIRWLQTDHGITFEDVDYGVVSTEETEDRWRPTIAELCTVDAARRNALAEALEQELARPTVRSANWVTRVLRRMVRG